MAIVPAVKVKEIGYENNLPYAEGWGKYTEALMIFNQGKLPIAAKLFPELIQKTAGLHTRLVVDCFVAMMLYLQIKGKHEELEETIEKFRQYSTSHKRSFGKFGPAFCTGTTGTIERRHRCSHPVYAYDRYRCRRRNHALVD